MKIQTSTRKFQGTPIYENFGLLGQKLTMPRRSPQPTSLSEVFSEQKGHYDRHLLKPRSLRSPRGNDHKRQRIILEEYHEEQHPHSNYQDKNTLSFRSHHAAFAPNHVVETRNRETGPGLLDLRPCHICHRKPTRKSDLDSYANCEACGERTCYICIRECLGPALPMEAIMHRIDEATEAHENHDDNERFKGDKEKDEMSFEFHSVMDEKHEMNHGGHERESGDGNHGEDLNMMWEHHRVVCSRCCIEKGADGEVRCLGCLRAEGEG